MSYQISPNAFIVAASVNFCHFLQAYKTASFFSHYIKDFISHCHFFFNHQMAFQQVKLSLYCFPNCSGNNCVMNKQGVNMKIIYKNEQSFTPITKLHTYNRAHRW